MPLVFGQHQDLSPPSLLIIHTAVAEFGALVAQAARLAAPPLIFADLADNRLASIEAIFAAGAVDFVGANDDEASIAGRIAALIAAGRSDVSQHSARLHLADDRITARVDGHSARLTAKEYGLLSEFAAHANRTLSRNHLIRAVWGWHHLPSTRTLDMHVSRLRRKLGLAARSHAARPGTPLIRTIFGYGYRFELPLDFALDLGLMPDAGRSNQAA